jgi:hypothetical protein
MPWYSNETALSSAGAGEELVAACVWQKILCAWMHGSVDYIWYNLRAIGFGPYDGEQGYGVMTADFYPRASYVAFAGLTSCFEGLRPRGIVHEGKNREVYLFSGVREGRDVQVFVGWDRKLETNIAVRIYTDAKRAFSVDLFDNRKELQVADGVVALSIGKVPSAVMLEDVSRASLDEADACRCEKSDVLDVKLGADGYEFDLQDFDCVFEMYKADPRYFDRVWKGWNDLRAKVSIRHEGDELLFVADTRDEKIAEGDCLVVIVNGAERRFVDKEPIKNGARYVGRIACPGPGDSVEVRIEDDDGRGKEGWMASGLMHIILGTAIKSSAEGKEE